jgi:hypothetical protein
MQMHRGAGLRLNSLCTLFLPTPTGQVLAQSPDLIRKFGKAGPIGWVRIEKAGG